MELGVELVVVGLESVWAENIIKNGDIYHFKLKKGEEHEEHTLISLGVCNRWSFGSGLVQMFDLRSSVTLSGQKLDMVSF
jgi:hypothetical protein